MTAHKGPSSEGERYGHRWIMRSSNGSTWITTGRYLAAEVNEWWCAKPLMPFVQVGDDC